MLRVECPRCQTLLEVKTHEKQETISCSECGQKFIGIADEVTYGPDRIRRSETLGPDLCGIFGFVAVLSGLGLFLCPPVGLGVALIGLVLATVGLKSRYRGLAVASLLLGSVGAIFSVGFFFLYGTTYVFQHEQFKRQNTPFGNPQPRFQVK